MDNIISYCFHWRKIVIEADIPNLVSRKRFGERVPRYYLRNHYPRLFNECYTIYCIPKKTIIQQKQKQKSKVKITFTVLKWKIKYIFLFCVVLIFDKTLEGKKILFANWIFQRLFYYVFSLRFFYYAFRKHKFIFTSLIAEIIIKNLFQGWF